MAPRSLAEAGLEMIAGVLPEARAMYLLCADKAGMSFEIIVSELAQFEAMCKRRVEETTYENHRRRLEACHVQADVPQARKSA